MKIVLIGANGRMGKEVVKALKLEDVAWCVDKDDHLDEKFDAEIIIDFSTAGDRTKYVEFAKAKSVPYCCFSTAISAEDEKQLKDLSQRVPVLICSNSSTGMQSVFDAVAVLGKELNCADIVLTEYHHKTKRDNPSGTAKRLQKIVNESGQNCQVVGFRVGNEQGTHILQFFLEDEIIEIKHVAKSRKIFAIGAIKMARKMLKAKAGLYIK